MENDTKYELNAINVSEQPPSPNTDGASILEKQTRTRRLFSFAQLFAFHLMYMGTWGGTVGNSYYALQNGGVAAWFFGYLIVACGALCQTASFAEMASIQPIAGAQYYWTFHFAPDSMKLFLTWIQGWTTWFGYVAMLASSVNYGVVILEAAVQLTHPDYQSGGWRTTLIILALLLVVTLINIYAFWLVPWFELITGIFNICLFLVCIVILWSMSERNSPGVFLTTNVSSGWDSYFVSANVGSLSSIWLFIGFESVVHMGEETKHAKRAAPRALFWSIFTNIFMGLVMLITSIICMPSVEVLLNSANPFVTLILHSMKSAKAATAILAFKQTMDISSQMTTVSSVSRLTWAWARDGGLPKYFGHVDGKHRVPIRAVVLTCLIVMVLALLNLGSATYVALGAITSLSSLSLYMSYAVVLFCLLYRRLTTGIELGEWNLGKAGLVLNVVALIYTLWAMVWLPFPSMLPVTASNMNYASPAFGVVIIGAITLWFVHARKHWHGPNRAIVQIVLHNDS